MQQVQNAPMQGPTKRPMQGLQLHGQARGLPRSGCLRITTDHDQIHNSNLQWHSGTVLTAGGRHGSAEMREPNARHVDRSQFNLVQHPGKPATNIPTVISWQPPTQMKTKMNIDAAADFKHLKIGVGAVIRGHNGEVIAALSKPIQGCFKSDEMEAKALFHSINWVINCGLQLDIIETDALRVSNAVNSSKRDCSNFSDLISDVCSLLSSFSRVNVTHAKRQANMAAHGLAKYALGLDEEVSWMGDIPNPIFSIIVNELVS